MTHKHRMISESEPRPFTGTVNPQDPWEAAHGGICVTERCKCGHERNVNVNGNHAEYGHWHQPEQL